MSSFKVTNFLFFLFLVSLVLNGKIQCQLEPNKWVKDKSIKISERQLIASTIYGVDLVVDDGDFKISQEIKKQGQYQGYFLRNMARFVGKNSTFLNVGSHIGVEAVVLGKILGDNGKMFIIQPYSINHNVVLKSIYLNGLGQKTTLYEAGCSNIKTTGSIYVSPTQTSAGLIFTNPDVATPPKVTEVVYVDLIDNILPKNAIIDFALLDVERLEVECLYGMKETILRSPNIIILCEWANVSHNTKDIQTKKEQLLRWFVDHKFKFYYLQYNGNCTNSPWAELPYQNLKGRKDILDILFVPAHINPNTIDY